MSDAISGQLIIYIQDILNGTKPVANMPLQDRYVDEVVEIVKGYNLYTHVEELSNDGWKSIFIYKLPYLLEVIKSSPQYPKTTYEHWILGKMFGYSDEVIGEFVNK